MKKKLLVAALVLLIAVGGAVGVYAYLKYQVAYEGVITGDCAGPITLYRSREGFPVADVADESDALYALGFLHAQDRLPVLEYYRSLINPEGTPMIADAADAERVRLLLGVSGVRAAAEAALAGIPPQDRTRLERYVAGINLYRARYGYKERLAEQYRAAAWTAQDVLGILNLMEFSSALSCSAEMVFSCREKNDRILADILPENRRIMYDEADARTVKLIREYAQALQRYTGLYLAGTGYLTAQDSGLAGLKLTSSPRLFPKWYPVSFRINGKWRDVATIAGLPFAYHIRGESRYYSLFSAPADTVDFVRITLSSDATGLRYRSGTLAGSVSELKDSTGRVYARGTEAGVLVSDVFGDNGDSAVAMHYRHPDAVAVSFLLSLMSTDVRAADIRPGMVLNPKLMLYADSSGRGAAAFGAAAQMNPSRKFIGAGAQPGGGSFALREPVSGEAVITSDYWPWPTAPFRITRSSRSRYELVRREIAAGNGVNDLMRISFGSSSEFAARMVPYVENMTAKLPVTSAKLTRLYFSEWDRRYEHSAVAPALFQTLLSEYFNALLSDEIGDDVNGLFPIMDEVLPWYTDAVQRGVSPLFDDTATDDIREDRDSLYDRVFITTLRRMHRSFGPRIEKWTLDAITEKGETPLIDAEELGRVRVFTPDGDATSFNQTIYSPEADGRIGVTAFTAMSVIFSDTLLVSADYPVSVRLFSRYNATKHGIYGTVQPADTEHRMTIQPGESE